LSDDNNSKLSIKEIAIRGTIIAVIITVPSLISFVIAWTVLNDLLYAVILGGAVHFITMGFSLKISKKLRVKK